MQYMQIWALGRVADPAILEVEGGFPLVGASDIVGKEAFTKTQGTPRLLSIPEINEYVNMFSDAAENALEADFDGVEIHAAYGYLIDQFTQDVTNNRTDEYGGSIENRVRFALEVIDAVIQAIGASRTGIRTSPWASFQYMGMENPVPTFTYLVQELAKHSLAYIHVSDTPMELPEGIESDRDANDFIRNI